MIQQKKRKNENFFTIDTRKPMSGMLLHDLKIFEKFFKTRYICLHSPSGFIFT